MQTITRRNFLRTSLASAIALGAPGLDFNARRSVAAPGPSDTVNVAVVGLGGLDVIGGVGGRGRQLIAQLRRVPSVRIAALCDVDQAVLEHGAREFKERGESVTRYTDVRKLLQDPTISAVFVALPNHWHALATIWACQAGKDVYVEKPFSYNLWEGRQMVAAARKNGRIVQVGTQSRSSAVLRDAFAYLHRGELGPIRCAHALVYRPRESLGKVSAPLQVPSAVDYDLWCGPAPKVPLLRKQLHYEWHWFWPTGNGEIGNNGVHVIDICRWALGQNQPLRAISIGGRFAFNDGGETPNTQIALFDFQPAPLICEVRNLKPASGEADALTRFRGRNGGVVIDCEGGYLAGDAAKATVFDRDGKQIKQFTAPDKTADPEAAHVTNFIDAVRSRNGANLAAEALQGHYSATACHMANTSHRLGTQRAPESILETIRANHEFSEAFERGREHLRSVGVDLSATPAVLGPWLTLDPAQDQFTGSFAEEANRLSRREDRHPFVVPNLA